MFFIGSGSSSEFSSEPSISGCVLSVSKLTSEPSSSGSAGKSDVKSFSKSDISWFSGSEKSASELSVKSCGS